MDPPVNVLGAVGVTGLQHLHKLIIHAFYHCEDAATDTVWSGLSQTTSRTQYRHTCTTVQYEATCHRQHHGLNTGTHVQLYSTKLPVTDNITDSIQAHMYNCTVRSYLSQTTSRTQYRHTCTTVQYEATCHRQHHGLNTGTHVQLYSTKLPVTDNIMGSIHEIFTRLLYKCYCILVICSIILWITYHHRQHNYLNTKTNIYQIFHAPNIQ